MSLMALTRDCIELAISYQDKSTKKTYAAPDPDLLSLASYGRASATATLRTGAGGSKTGSGAGNSNCATALSVPIFTGNKLVELPKGSVGWR